MQLAFLNLQSSPLMSFMTFCIFIFTRESGGQRALNTGRHTKDTAPAKSVGKGFNCVGDGYTQLWTLQHYCFGRG